METSQATVERGALAAGPGHPPVILRLGPRDYSVLVYARDEDSEPVYPVGKEKIKAACTAGVLAPKFQERKP